VPFLRMREIAEMSHEDREKRLSELRSELMKLRASVHAGGAVENPARIREIRRAIARILTVEKEIKLGKRRAEPRREAKG
jgi:large subunit ribosomal protein L29